MRYEDASGAFQASGPVANDDSDTLAAGSRGPATGNLITGEGTQYGSSGADSAAGAHITSIGGKGGEDSSFAAGKLSVAGEYGQLSVDAEGNYSYLANKGAPENVRDRFTYTLADNAGNSDTAALIVEIGKTPVVIKADAQQVIVGPDGVVTLPPGVELSDIMVVGRNLVVNMPDGTQLVIVDGAIFVPQLVLGGVEVPASNVAALLIGQEPQPAAGETPPSSGGNFALPPPPLDPGVPLGDLLPPTEYTYRPPEPQETFLPEDEEVEVGPNPDVLLDDDAQPNGIAGGVGDDEGTNFASGFLSGSGGDGQLIWDLLTSGAPTGFSYADGPDGSVLVFQDGNPNPVLTITIDPETGEFTVTQNQPLDHAAGDNENNSLFTINYTVTDEDGDSAAGSFIINVDDDTPTVDATVGPDANVQLTTQDAETIGADTDVDTTTADFGGIFGASGAFGADGPGTSSLSYALSTTGGASGLTHHGSAINLYLIGGVVVGSTAATAGAVDASNTVFDISVDASGVVTVHQYSQIDHTNTDPSPTGPAYDDHLINLVDGSVTLTLTASVTDGDGDTVTDTASVGIGANIRFADDGPSIDPTLNEVGGAVVDESEPVEAATIPLADGYTRGDDPHLAGGLAIGKGSTSGPVIDANAVFGADGPANGGGISYALEVLNEVSGLTTTEGTAINLVELSNGVVVGVVDGTTTVAFAISIDSGTGVVTVEQYLSLFHPDSPDNHDEPVFLDEGSLGVTVTATDFDGDSVTSDAVDITSLIRFEDDGPVAEGAVNPAGAVTVDESGPTSASTIEFTGDEGDDGDVAGSGPIGRAVGVAAVVNASSAFGADGPAADAEFGYALALGGSDTDLTLTDGSAIELQLIDGVIVGVVTEGPHDGEAAFAIAINPDTGVATVELYLSLDHPDINDPNDSLPLGPNTVDVIVTATDGDGDTDDSDPIDVSGLFNFLDDGPSVEGEVDEQGAVTVDESGPTGASTIEFTGDEGDDGDVAGSGPIGRAVGGTAVVNASALFGADGPAGADLTYALALGGSDTALTLTDGSAIELQLIDGVIVGVVTEGPHDGEAAFAIAIDPNTGIATVELYLSLDHPDITNHNDSLPLGPNTIDVVVTATDGDGDSVDSDPVDISGLFNFLDDGPSVTAELSDANAAVVDESEPVAAAAINTDPYVKGNDPHLEGGLAIGSGSTSGAVVDAEALFGADGEAAANSLTYDLVILNPDSGITTTEGHPINLVELPSGVIVGVVSGGPFNGMAAFAIQINSATGVVTVEQYLSLDHPIFPNDFDEPLFLDEGVLGATVTATDGDGDTDTSDAVDVGSKIRFEDDGPSASDEAQQDVQEGNQTIAGTFDFVGGADGASVTHINGTALVFGGDGWSQWIPVDDGQIRAQADGDYQFQTDASGSGVTSGTYTVTDGDGDQDIGTWAFNITDANSPTAGTSAARLDDDGLTGGNPASTTGDIDANVGEAAPANPEEDIFHGQLTLNFGGDGPGTVTFAAMHGVVAAVGMENVTYSWNAGTSTLTATVTGGARDGTVLFDIVVNQTTGEYTLTLRDNVIHAAGGDEASAPNVALTYTVTDSDNSPPGGVNGTLNITFNDDAPSLTNVQPGSGVDLDESDGLPTFDTSAGAVISATQAFGADGAAAANSAVYGLAITGGPGSGLFTAVGNFAITLVQIDSDTIEGHYNGSNVAFIIQMNPNGTVTLTQNVALEHNTDGPPGPAHNDTLNLAGLINATLTITDGDGDTASTSVGIGGNLVFFDDGPDAVNDVANQATENTAVNINVFANDDPGTDGTTLASGIAVVPGSLTGTGNLVYNGNGTFTYTPSAGEEGVVTFQYQLTDNDGDTDVATVTINLQPDSTPSAVDGVAKVDDDGLPAGIGDNATGDLDANSGEAPVVNPSEAVWHGQLVATAGGDTIANYSFASMHGTSGSVGTETVNYTWNNGTSTLTATISGGARNGQELFNVVVNQSTGSYNLTLVRPVMHADEVANQENDATTNLTFTVTDSDGDPDTGIVTVTFDDDMPVVSDVTDPLEIENTGATPSGTGNFAFDIGADQNADFDDISVSGFTITINGEPAINPVLTPNVDGSGNPAPETATTASYRFTFQYDTGTGGPANGVGTLVFNKATGQYTVTLLSGPIEGFTTLETAQGTDFVGYEFNTSTPDNTQPAIAVTTILEESAPGEGDGFYVQFTGFGAGNGSHETIGDGTTNTFTNGDLFSEGTGLDALHNSWVSVSGSANGVGGDQTNGPDALNFNLYSSDPTGTYSGQTGNTPTASANDMFLHFDTIGASHDMVVVLKLWSDTNGNGVIDAVGDTFTTKAIVIQPGDIYKFGAAEEAGTVAALTNTQWEGVLNDIVALGGSNNNDGLVIIESSDYNGTGENWQIVGAQVVNAALGVTGDGINLNPAVGAGGDSDADDNGSLDTQNVSAVTDTGPLKIMNIGFTAGTTTDQSAVIEFDVTIEDADGDQVVVQDVTVNIGDPVGGASLPQSTMLASSELAGDDSSFSNLSYTNDNGKWGGLGNGPDKNFSSINNTGIVAGIVAAAGLQSASVAAATLDHTISAGMQDMVQSAVLPAYQLQPFDAGSLSIQSFGLESREPVLDFGALQDSGRGFDFVDMRGGLDIQSYGDAVPAYQPNFGVDQAPAFDASMLVTAAAPTVGMPSAEALIAAGIVAGGQQGGSVEQILADALGSAAPTVDGLLQGIHGGAETGSPLIEAALNAMPNGGGAGELSAVLNGASPDAGSVSSWDMGMAGSFAGGFDMMFKMDVATLHQDAVQPTVNG